MSKKITEYKVHEMAKLYPKLSPDERISLKESIKQSGVLYPIVLFPQNDDLFLIDGRNRADIVEELLAEGVTHAENGRKIECPVLRYEGTLLQAVDFVRDLNLSRRMLSSSQKAAIAYKSGLMFKRYAKHEGLLEDAEETEQTAGDFATKVADTAGTNRQYVFDVAKIASVVTNLDLIDRMAEGELNIPQAKKIAARRAEDLPDVPPPGGDSSTEDTGDGTPPAAVNHPEIFDGLKKVVAPEHQPIFLVRDTVKEIKKKIKHLIADVINVSDSTGGDYFSKSEMKSALDGVTKSLNLHQPHVICPNCNGTGKGENGRGKCKSCGGKMFMDKLSYNLVPPELKQAMGDDSDDSGGDDGEHSEHDGGDS